MERAASAKQKFALLASLIGLAGIATSLSARADFVQHAAVCRSYASKAVEQQRRNLNSNCGYRGVAWNLDHKAHYGWCLTLKDAPYFSGASNESSKREKALKKCNAGKDTTGGGSISGSRCQIYVADALLKAAANIEHHCGYAVAGRFTQDANAHRRFCENNMKANNLAIINAEEAARTAAIDQCIKK